MFDVVKSPWMMLFLWRTETVFPMSLARHERIFDVSGLSLSGQSDRMKSLQVEAVSRYSRMSKPRSRSARYMDGVRTPISLQRRRERTSPFNLSLVNFSSRAGCRYFLGKRSFAIDGRPKKVPTRSRAFKKERKVWIGITCGIQKIPPIWIQVPFPSWKLVQTCSKITEKETCNKYLQSKIHRGPAIRKNRYWGRLTCLYF